MKNNKVLSLVKEKIILPLSKLADPQTFFKTRKGLYVWSSFEERILSNATSIESDKKISIMSGDLIIDATDEQIESTLPKSHLFSESEVCAVIADLISKQLKGEEGNLLNNGYANLFYTSAFVVGVSWYSSGGGWYVFAWRRGGYEWLGGLRVFSPATGN